MEVTYAMYLPGVLNMCFSNLQQFRAIIFKFQFGVTAVNQTAIKF